MRPLFERAGMGTGLRKSRPEGNWDGFQYLEEVPRGAGKRAMSVLKRGMSLPCSARMAADVSRYSSGRA